MGERFLLLFILYSCSSVNEDHSFAKKYQEAIFENDCETAQNNIPLEKDDTKYMRFYQGSMGYLVSIPMLSVTSLLDMMLMGRCQYGCPSTEQDKDMLEFLFPTTSWTYETTKELRCPDNSYYVNKFIEVAKCYEKRGDIDSLKTAQGQLSYLNEKYESGPRLSSSSLIELRVRFLVKEVHLVIPKYSLKY